MDEDKDIGKDSKEAPEGSVVLDGSKGGTSPQTHSETTRNNMSENVEARVENSGNKGLEVATENQCLIEDAAAGKNVHTSIGCTADANTGSPVDANSNSPIDTNTVDASIGSPTRANSGNSEDANASPIDSDMDANTSPTDANMDVDAKISSPANADIDVTTRVDAENCGVGGGTRDLSSDSDDETTPDANTDAECDLDAGAKPISNGESDSHTESDFESDSDGDEKMDADGSTYADTNTNGNDGTNMDTIANTLHENNVSDGSSLHTPIGMNSEVPSECKENEGQEEVKEEVEELDVDATNMKGVKQLYPWEPRMDEGSESGCEEDQAAFMKELEIFFKERGMDFRPPKFYGETLNCLKLWRAVIRLGGYEQVTSCKLWRQVGESFRPPKTCTTVSWTFRCFYEKALLEYEKHKIRGGVLSLPGSSLEEPTGIQNQVSGNSTGRARRDAAARAMQGWHSQRLLGNGEVGDPIIKDKNSTSTPKREKQLKSIGFLKRKKPAIVDHIDKVSRMKGAKPQLDATVIDVGAPADWVKVNVQRTKDCFEVYALVPGLLREEVRVQSDPAGRLVITGVPEQEDNPWGVTPFKKVVSLPSRIDPHQTSAVVTLHGQLFVRVPFEPADL